VRSSGRCSARGSAGGLAATGDEIRGRMLTKSPRLGTRPVSTELLPATSPINTSQVATDSDALAWQRASPSSAQCSLDGQHAKSPWLIACLEIVAKARYLVWTQGFPMKSARHTPNGGNAVGRLFWRWPLALSLALAVAISLFHDLSAFAGGGDPSPAWVTVVSSASNPAQAPDSQAPGHGCHCLCHMTAQAVASPAVSPVVFNEPLYLPPQDVPARSCAGLPPFRPPRV
jgi:hypothetical protein